MSLKSYSVVFALAITVTTSMARPTLAALNRRFDTGRLNSNQWEYVWTTALISQVREELRDPITRRRQAVLIFHRLSERTSDGYNVKEWAVLKENSRGQWLPVKPHPRFLDPELNWVATDADEYIPHYDVRPGFDRLRVYIVSGTWRVETRIISAEGVPFFDDWQAVETLVPGQVAVYLWEHDFFKREYRLIRAE